MLDRTLKFCTFSYKAILYIISNYQFICMNENEDIVFFLNVHIVCTQRNLNKVKKLFKNHTIIPPFNKIKRKFTHIQCNITDIFSQPVKLDNICKHINYFTGNFSENVQNLSE